PLRGRAPARRGVQHVRRARRPDRVRGRRPRPRHAPRVQSRDDADVHRLGPQGPVRGHPGRGRVRSLTASEALEEAVERFHPRMAMACSFQKEGPALLDIVPAVEPEARVFTIDTGVLFPETIETWRAFEERWGVKVEVFDARGEPPRGGGGPLRRAR